MIADLYFEAPTKSGFHSAYSFNQPQVESILEAATLERQVPLVRGFALAKLQQHPDHVEAAFEPFKSSSSSKAGANGVAVGGVVTNESDEESSSSAAGSPAPALTIQAAYIVGCDGANSTVRRLSEFTVHDLGFENDWLITDLIPHDSVNLPPRVAKVFAAQVCDPSRPTTVVFAGKGRRRFEFMRLPGESNKELLAEDKMWELIKPWGYDATNCDLERAVVYSFKARWANEFYKDRVILAGDSLHLMPPFIGQGLNSGFRDAHGLAWRLDMVLRANGDGDVGKLLASYESERKAHIKVLTDFCIKLGEIICETDETKSQALHAAIRANPPGRSYDPPLGRPGILTDQPESGHLGLQRKLKLPNGDKVLFDGVHGYGWRLISLGDTPVVLGEEAAEVFASLGGKCVSISDDEDYEGEYREWFTTAMAVGDAVLVRPDFYVFGHAPVVGDEVDQLVQKAAAMCRK